MCSQSLDQFELPWNFVNSWPIDGSPQIHSYSLMRPRNHTKLSERSRKMCSKLMTKFGSVRATLQLRQFMTHWRFATDSFVLPYAGSESHQTFRAISQDVFKTLDKVCVSLSYLQISSFFDPCDRAPQMDSYSFMRARNHTKLSGRSHKICSKLLTKFRSVWATSKFRQFMTHSRFASDAFVKF
jgi:hypothetical protein